MEMGLEMELEMEEIKKTPGRNLYPSINIHVSIHLRYQSPLSPTVRLVRLSNTIPLSDYLSCSTVRLCGCATVDVDINESEWYR